MEYPNLDGKEFGRIVNLFKIVFLVVSGGITILVSVALFVSNRELASMRKDIREEAKEIKSDLNELRDEATKNIDDTRAFSFEQIKNTREYAVREAQISAEQRINEIFLSTDIQSLIKSVTEENLRNDLNRLVDKEFARAQERINTRIHKSIELSYYQDQISKCNRDYLILIDSMMKFSNDEAVREIAKSIYDAKSKDYNEYYSSTMQRNNSDETMIDEALYFAIYLKNLPDTMSYNTKIDILTEKGYTTHDLCIAVKVIMVLNALTGENYHIFDFEKINIVRQKFGLPLLKNEYKMEMIPNPNIIW